jgi:hypothetical protein
VEVHSWLASAANLLALKQGPEVVEASPILIVCCVKVETLVDYNGFVARHKTSQRVTIAQSRRPHGSVEDADIVNWTHGQKNYCGGQRSPDPKPNSASSDLDAFQSGQEG